MKAVEIRSLPAAVSAGVSCGEKYIRSSEIGKLYQKMSIIHFLTQLQHLIGVKWLFGRLDSFFMGVVGTTDFIDPVAGMSR